MAQSFGDSDHSRSDSLASPPSAPSEWSTFSRRPLPLCATLVHTGETTAAVCIRLQRADISLLGLVRA